MVAEKSRGELGELRSQLTRLSGGGSSPEKIAQKREVFRKVIMLGTIGQDMSSLFMQVCADMRPHISTLQRTMVAAAQPAQFNSSLLVVAHRLLKYSPCASSQVITCAASDSQDIVLKKSLYQYITTYGTANSDLMLLTINMLLKDCQDQDPTIRGLALRSLCSLTISNLTEYLVSLQSQHSRYVVW
jgi:vesicle coat complex subunit